MCEGKFMTATLASPLSVHSIAELAYDTQKIRFVHFCLFRSLLQWTVNTTTCAITRVSVRWHARVVPGSTSVIWHCKTRIMQHAPQNTLCADSETVDYYSNFCSLTDFINKTSIICLYYLKGQIQQILPHMGNSACSMYMPWEQPCSGRFGCQGSGSVWCPSLASSLWTCVGIRTLGWAWLPPLGLCCCHAGSCQRALCKQPLLAAPWYPTSQAQAFAAHKTGLYMLRNSFPCSSDSAERGRYLENCTAERAMSDIGKKTRHLLPYGRRKKSHVILGCLNTGIMTH